MTIGLIGVDGKVEKELDLPPDRYAHLRVSPNGRRIAFTNERDKQATVYIRDVAGTSAPIPLTSGSNNRYPTWALDGTRVAYQSDRKGDLAIWWQAADGTGEAERLKTPAAGEAHAVGHGLLRLHPGRSEPGHDQPGDRACRVRQRGDAHHHAARGRRAALFEG